MVVVSNKPIRKPSHLRWVRTLPCCACKRTNGIDAAHVGPHGLSQKASDLWTVPLCRACHRLLHQVGRIAFEARTGVSLFAVVELLNERPLIRLAEQSWVGSFRREEYVLCAKNDSLAEAVRRMGRIRKEVVQEVIVNGKVSDWDCPHLQRPGAE